MNDEIFPSSEWFLDDLSRDSISTLHGVEFRDVTFMYSGNQNRIVTTWLVDALSTVQIVLFLALVSSGNVLVVRLVTRCRRSQQGERLRSDCGCC